MSIVQQDPKKYDIRRFKKGWKVREWNNGTRDTRQKGDW